MSWPPLDLSLDCRIAESNSTIEQKEATSLTGRHQGRKAMAPSAALPQWQVHSKGGSRCNVSRL